MADENPAVKQLFDAIVHDNMPVFLDLLQPFRDPACRRTVMYQPSQSLFTLFTNEILKPYYPLTEYESEYSSLGRFVGVFPFWEQPGSILRVVDVLAMMVALRGWIDCADVCTWVGEVTSPDGTIDTSVAVSLIVFATISGSLRMVQWLCTECATCAPVAKNAYTLDRSTPLMFATEHGHVDLVQYFESLGYPVSQTNHHENCPLLLAAARGQMDMLEYLLKQLDDSSMSVEIRLTETKNTWGDTALILAAYEGHVDMVERLQAKGLSLQDARDRTKQTLVQVAAIHGHVRMIMWLEQHGCKLNDKDQYESTPLLKAASGGHIQAIDYLVRSGCSLRERNCYGNTALLLAAMDGHVDTVKWLVEHGCSLDDHNNNKDTVVHLAAYRGHVELLKWLVEHDCSLEDETTRGDTPLILAAREGRLPALVWLLEQFMKGTTTSAAIAGARLNTAVEMAALFDQLEAIQLICSYVPVS